MAETNQESGFQLTGIELGIVWDSVMEAANAVKDIANRTEDFTEDNANVMAGLVKISFALRRMGTMLDMSNAELDEAIAVSIGSPD